MTHLGSKLVRNLLQYFEVTERRFFNSINQEILNFSYIQRASQQGLNQPMLILKGNF